MAQGPETATGFTRRNGELHVDGVPLSRIAEVAGTPSYVYSASVLRERAQRLTQALAGIPHRVHFAAKANGSAAVLRTLREQGIGVDVVSGGELFGRCAPASSRRTSCLTASARRRATCPRRWTRA